MKRTRLGILLAILVLLIGVCVLIPIFRPGLLVTDDAEWMVIRLSAFYQSLSEGQFPVRFLGRLNQSYGYPVANFLYPGFLYTGSVLRLFGIPFQNIIEIILAASVLLGAFGMYLWMKKRFSEIPSAMAALSFLVSPYLLYDAYKRGSIGELFAVAFAISSFCAIDWKVYILLPITTLFLSIGHNTAAFFFLPLVFLYIFMKNDRKALLPFFLGVGMSAFFWIPALLERRFVMFSATAVSDPSHFFAISIKMAMFHAIFFLAGLGVLIVKKPKEDRNERLFFGVVLCIILTLSTPISAYIWNIPAFSQLIQFPYRFHLITIVFGPWCIAYLLEHRKDTTPIILAALAVFVFLAWPYLRRTESVVRPEGFFTTNEGTTTVKDEYMPRWVSKQFEERANKRIEFYQGSGSVKEKTANAQTIDIVVDANEPSVLQINTLYYPGWGGALDNQPIRIVVDNPYGVMRIPVPSGIHHLSLSFRETILRFIADCLSFVCFVWYAIWVFLSMLRKKYL